MSDIAKTINGGTHDQIAFRAARDFNTPKPDKLGPKTKQALRDVRWFAKVLAWIGLKTLAAKYGYPL